MSNYDRQFGNQGYGTYGKANFLQASGTDMQFITFKDFTGGYSAKDAREDTPPSFTPNSLDTYVTVDDRLTVVPGTTVNDTLTGRNPRKVVLHTSLDFTSDLVMFDPPYIGIKHEGDTEWFDVGLPVGNRKYQATNFGGTLLFSNGNTGMYAREVEKHTVELVEGAPAARAYATFAGRVFAGYAIIDGNRQPLGISWSGADSNYKTWNLFNEDGASTGAGFELLIDDMAAGDAIVALRPMGLDFMAVILRHSIWVARRTGDLTRPADFQPRVPGVGAITNECCKTTRFGVVFLADGPGVYLFDGNAAQFISDEITIDLKRMSRTELASCTAEYNPLNRCYYLFTPLGTFVYDFERKRWHKRSLLAYGATVFASQIPQVIWGEITGTWADHEETWQDLNPEELDDLQFFFLGDHGGAPSLEVEDEASFENFLVAMEPYWEFPLQEALYSTQLITTKQILLNYDTPGTIDLYLPDNDGAYELDRTAILAGTGQLTKIAFGEHTGKGAGLKILFTVGKPRISRVQLGIILRGPRIEPIEVVRSLELVSDGLIIYENFAVQPDGPGLAGWTPAPVNHRAPYVEDGALVIPMLGGQDNGSIYYRQGLVNWDTVWQLTQMYPLNESQPAVGYGIGRRVDPDYQYGAETEWGHDIYSNTGFDIYTFSLSEYSDSGFSNYAEFDWVTADNFPPPDQYFTTKLQVGTILVKAWGPNSAYCEFVRNPLAESPNVLLLETFSRIGGVEGEDSFFRVRSLAGYTGNKVMCLQVPDGHSVRIGSLVSADHDGLGTVTIDLDRQPCPFEKIEILRPDGSTLVEHIRPEGVWGGSTYSYGPVPV